MIILKKDIFYVFNNLKKMNYVYFFFIVFMLIISYVSNRGIFLDDSYSILGLDFDLEKNNIISILSYFMYILYFIFLSINLFIKDFKVSPEIYFLRFSKLKWSIMKILSSNFLLLFIRFVYYIFIAICFNNFGILKFILFDFIFISLINALCIICLSLALKWKILIFWVLVLCNNYIFLDIVNVSDIYFFKSLFVCLALNVFLVIFLYKKNTNIFERLG